MAAAWAEETATYIIRSLPEAVALLRETSQPLRDARDGDTGNIHPAAFPSNSNGLQPNSNGLQLFLLVWTPLL